MAQHISEYGCTNMAPTPEAVTAPTTIVQIWCRNFMTPKDIDINVFWRRDGNNNARNVSCTSCKLIQRIGDWLRRPNTKVSCITGWFQPESRDGKSHQQVLELFTGQSASHIIESDAPSKKREDHNGNCQSEQQTKSKSPLPIVPNDNTKKTT